MLLAEYSHLASKTAFPGFHSQWASRAIQLQQVIQYRDHVLKFRSLYKAIRISTSNTLPSVPRVNAQRNDIGQTIK